MVLRFLHPPLLVATAFCSGPLAVTAPARTPPRYTIGFADTLLYNDSLRYTAFGYDGPPPLFVQAWFPIEEPTERTAVACV